MKYNTKKGGEKLKRVRGSMGLSIRDLSKITGINENNIGKYERGLHNPTIEIAAIIAKALECEISDIWSVSYLEGEFENESGGIG